jgi:hypothetical protein
VKQDQQASGGKLRLQRNDADSRYELWMDERLAAFASYQETGGSLRLTHTEVDSAFEGQGLGSRLAAYALDDARTRGLKVLPLCRFIAGYIARHEQEYADLVAS